MVLCLLGGGAVGALGTLSIISASTGADAAASMKWRPDAFRRSRARSGGSSPSESVLGLLIATLTTSVGSKFEVASKVRWPLKEGSLHTLSGS